MQNEILLAIAGVVIMGILLPLVAWLGADRIKRLEHDAEEAKSKVHNDINAIGGKLSAFQLEVAKEYISFDRLTAIFRPVEDRLKQIEESIEKVFDRLDGKVDKGNGRSHTHDY
jgi:hypothetical protein